MDKIWDRNPSKSDVIVRCGGDEKTEWPRTTDKSRKLIQKTQQVITCCLRGRIYKMMLSFLPRKQTKHCEIFGIM